MVNHDQAEGLRRMLEGSRPRVLTFLSALRDKEKSGMLVNLGASFARQGSHVLLFDARGASNGIGRWLGRDSQATLLDVVRQRRTMEDSVQFVSVDMSVALLCRNAHALESVSLECSRQLSKAFSVLAQRADVVMVDADIDHHDAFPISALADGDIVIQVSGDADSIKKAYGLIKRVHQHLGKREYGILVSGANERQAGLVFSNMAQAASRYLAVPLRFTGYIPEDEYLTKATNLGRSVIDAFPLAGASRAFNRLAEGLVWAARPDLNLNGLSKMGAHLGI